ncbi:hypothetical protein V8E54_007650 [Elaphomyces granulatus]
MPATWSFEDAGDMEDYLSLLWSIGAPRKRSTWWMGSRPRTCRLGLAAVQVAKAKGATVIATAGTRKIAQDFGADSAGYMRLVGMNWGQYPKTVAAVWRGIFDLTVQGKFREQPSKMRAL